MSTWVDEEDDSGGYYADEVIVSAPKKLKLLGPDGKPLFQRHVVGFDLTPRPRKDTK
jgi:hypothetical protein